MKTNHVRGFTDPGSFTHPCMRRKFWGKKLKTKVAWAFAPGWDAVNGHRGHAKAKAGAKKHIRVQERIEGKQLCKETE